MPRTTSSTRTTTSRAKIISISIHSPGEEPKVIKVKAGSTVKDVIEHLNLEGYTLSLNGSEVKADSTKAVEKSDILRIGVKTKNA